jgi:hypothetical protein
MHFASYRLLCFQSARKPEFASETAVLLMDSASPHASERVLQLLGRNKIMAIVFLAHTTNIFQALDLVFFGVLKKIKQMATGKFDERSLREQITKPLQAYEQTATSMTIRPSFQKAGLWPDSEIKPFKLQFNEESRRENPGLKELWGRNILVEELSERRKLQPFEIINKQFL